MISLSQAGPLWSPFKGGDVGLDEDQGGLDSFKKTVVPASLGSRRIKESAARRCGIVSPRAYYVLPSPTNEASHV